jgi:toxin YoeB
MRKKNIIFSAEAWDDYMHWQKMNKKKKEKINSIIEILVNYFFSTGSKQEITGMFSISIDIQNRLVYSFDESHLYIISCRKHE